MHEQIRWDFILEAITPIAHSSESIGNTSLLMREKRRLPDGTFVHVPIITGDTMRHGLREAAAYATLDAAGMLDNPSLGESALRLLFAGGMITGSEGGAIKLDDYRKMIDLCPHLGLLGGCAQNRAIPGKIQVDAANLICSETAHQLPDWIVEWLKEQKIALQSCRSHTEEVQRVRMDPTLNPSKRQLLTDGGSNVEKRLRASEKGKEEKDVVLAQDNKSSMMPRRHETIVGGSLFYWSVCATLHSDLELDTFRTMIGAFLRDARVGGKQATGHGKIRPILAKQLRIQRPKEMPETLDAGALAPKIGSIFYEHIKARKSEVETFLRSVSA